MLHYFLYGVFIFLSYLVCNFNSFDTPSKIYNNIKKFCPESKNLINGDTKFNYSVLYILFGSSIIFSALCTKLKSFYDDTKYGIKDPILEKIILIIVLATVGCSIYLWSTVNNLNKFSKNLLPILNSSELQSNTACRDNVIYKDEIEDLYYNNNTKTYIDYKFSYNTIYGFIIINLIIFGITIFLQILHLRNYEYYLFEKYLGSENSFKGPHKP